MIAGGQLRVSTGRAFAAVVVMGLVLAGCSKPAPPPAGSKHVTIDTPDGEHLDAIELGSGPDVAVLSHGGTGTMDGYYPLVPALAEAGWRVIAYNARGVGESTGDRGVHRDVDLQAVVDHVRATGATTLMLVGASLGAGLSVAMARALNADAIVLLSVPADAFGAVDAARGLRGTPAFVVAAEGNSRYPEDAKLVAGALGVTATIVDGDEHGTGMFHAHPELVDAIVAFAARVRTAKSATE
jgi:pimeloyl-ACP methyl ester carboxylesterase